MTNAVIKNNHASALGVGNVSIAGNGGTAQIKNWQIAKRANAVSILLDQKIIEVVSEDDAPKSLSGGLPLPVPAGLPDPGTGLPMPGGGDEGEAKQALIDELATYGIDKTKRSSLENLQKELDAVKASGAKPKKGRS
jgi:hypothetical protein